MQHFPAIYSRNEAQPGERRDLVMPETASRSSATGSAGSSEQRFDRRQVEQIRPEREPSAVATIEGPAGWVRRSGLKATPPHPKQIGDLLSAAGPSMVATAPGSGLSRQVGW